MFSFTFFIFDWKCIFKFLNFKYEINLINSCWIFLVCKINISINNHHDYKEINDEVKLKTRVFKLYLFIHSFFFSNSIFMKSIGISLRFVITNKKNFLNWTPSSTRRSISSYVFQVHGSMRARRSTTRVNGVHQRWQLGTADYVAAYAVTAYHPDEPRQGCVPWHGLPAQPRSISPRSHIQKCADKKGRV